MSITEAIGLGFIVLMTLIGICTLLFLAHQGVLRLKGRLEIGGTHENAAVRDHLLAAFDDSIMRGRR